MLMKRSSLIALIAVAAFMGVLLYSFAGNMSRYTDFASARQTPGDEVHVVAAWVQRDNATYDPSTDTFTFYLQDSLGGVQRAVYADPKPANFEQAEKIVAIGRFLANQPNGDFQVEKVLMKCPSKYEGQETVTEASAK